jgi:hypothetical protein
MKQPPKLSPMRCIAIHLASWGKRQRVLPVRADPNSRISIRYPASHSVDPHGLSGCGLWVAENNLAGEVWTPAVSLIGLVTDWFAQDQLLVGYRIEELIKFLKTKRQWMRAD